MTTARTNAHRMAKLHSQAGFVPDYEMLLEKRYRQLIDPGDCVVDIGAHSGRHTEVFARLVGAAGSVLAFEPLPEARNHIEFLALGANVKTYPYALSNSSGLATFYRAIGALQESGLRVKDYNNPGEVLAEQFEVEVRRLDEFLPQLSGVNFVKIDAEGVEIDCLLGAVKTLCAHRPYVSVEYGRPSYSAYGHTASTLFERAQAMGYRIGDLFGSIVFNLAEWEETCDVSYWDWFLIPEERVADWSKRFSTLPESSPIYATN